MPPGPPGVTEEVKLSESHSRPQDAKFKRLKKFKDSMVLNMDELHGDWRTYIIAIGESKLLFELRCLCVFPCQSVGSVRKKTF